MSDHHKEEQTNTHMNPKQKDSKKYVQFREIVD